MGAGGQGGWGAEGLGGWGADKVETNWLSGKYLLAIALIVWQSTSIKGG